MNHTPGPWKDGIHSGKIDKNLGRGHFVNTVAEIENWGKYGVPARIADCYGNQGEANARLIAAAPDMLEALEVLVKMVADGDWTTIELNEARAAIAKAKGEK